MIYLLIKNGAVENIIEASPEFSAGLVSQYDHVLPSTNDTGSPHIGDLYDGVSFSKPAPIPVSHAEKVQDKLDAIAFGQNLMAEFAVTSDARNLTVNERLQLLEMLSPVQGLMLVGDLTAASAVLQSLATSALLPPQLAQAFMQKISDYLLS